MSFKKLMFFLLSISFARNIFSIEKCGICFEDIDDNQIVLYKNEQTKSTSDIEILPCGHFFCKACISRWFRKDIYQTLSCPTCRQNANPSELGLNEEKHTRFKENCDLIRLMEIRSVAIKVYCSEIRTLINLNLLKSQYLNEFEEKSSLFIHNNHLTSHLELILLDNIEENEQDNDYLVRKLDITLKVLDLANIYDLEILKIFNKLKESISSDNENILNKVNVWFEKLNSSLSSKDELIACANLMSRESQEIQLNHMPPTSSLESVLGNLLGIHTIPIIHIIGNQALRMSGNQISRRRRQRSEQTRRTRRRVEQEQTGENSDYDTEVIPETDYGTEEESGTE